MTLIVWHNAKVWLGNNEWADCIAAKDGVIVAVGQNAQNLLSTADQIFDVASRSLLPAFGDGHAHPINGGIETLFAPVNKARSLDELLKIVQKYANENPDVEIIRGEGYDPSLAPRGEFQASWLDSVVSDRPIVLRALDYHTAWLNTAALKWCGITEETSQPSLGEICLDELGKPSGTLREWGAWNLAYQKLPPLTDDQKLAAVKYATNYYASHGVTWLQDAWVDDEIYQSWLIGAKAGILKQRVNLAWLASPLENWKDSIPLWKERREYLAKNYATQLSANSVKIFVDGILEGGTASVLESYCDCPGNGIPNWSESELTELIEAVIQNGFQPHIHAIGDAGIRDALDALESAKNKFGSTNNAVIAHSQLISPQDRIRYKEIGVIANFEPYWAQLSEEQVELTIPRIGLSRAELQYPIATMLKLGTTVSFGSDWPVTTGAPILGIATAVTRQTEDGEPAGGWVPDERIDLNQAIAAYTSGVAAQAGESEKWGQIKTGFRADLVAFDCDLTQVPSKDLLQAKVTNTWLAGIKVFDSQESSCGTNSL